MEPEKAESPVPDMVDSAIEKAEGKASEVILILTTVRNTYRCSSQSEKLKTSPGQHTVFKT